jgi:DNA polymerase III subunit delta'
MAFNSFPEQSAVIHLLQRSLERNRLAHAYLFTGTDIGELEAVARTLAKTLDCEQPVPGLNGVAIDSCDRCPTCVRVDQDNHPDVSWVRPESKSRVITIDQMRDLMQTINLKPSVSKFKVAILSAVDRLNVQAANAFLKTLEEPPPRSILILLTTEPQRLLDTILSRCLRLNFSGERKLSEGETAWVKSFAEMAANAQAGLLGRYRLLGVLADQLGQQKERIRSALTEKSPLQRYDDLDPKQRERFEDELEAAIESEYRRQRSDLLLALQIWLRDVWLRSTGTAADLLAFSDMMPMTSAVAERVSPRDALQNLQVVEQTYRLLGTNIQEALALEVGFLRLKL